METDIRYNKALEMLEGYFSAFHKVGSDAYKPGLERSQALDAALGYPSRQFASVHVAGTNGKGSTACTLAAVLTSAGYRTGLYTSPHLVDFRERIRVDGAMIDKSFVADFMESYASQPADMPQPSYFELVTAMAFCYFASRNVDVAIIETGLGGRLDSTNILNPGLSIITNISLDHMALLGDTPEAIAAEKAGIIKPNVPVVIGEASGSVRDVFRNAAAAKGSPAIFACDNPLFTSAVSDGDTMLYKDTPWGDIRGQLTGDCQKLNTATVLNALVVLSEHFDISPDAVRNGFADVCSLSGLAGRWMQLHRNGISYICDTGHNAGAWQYLGPALARLASRGRVSAVLGFVADKDISAILPYMPREADYYFVAPSVSRARPAGDTAGLFAAAGITGTVCGSVAEGVKKASQACTCDADVVFVGGSTFVVAEFLAMESLSA